MSLRKQGADGFYGLSDKGNGSDQTGGVGVEVIGNGSEATECFLASYTPGVKRYGDIELDGKVAAGR